MNKLAIAATTLFLASTATAHAGGNTISFQIEGQHIRIETPRNCASLNCVTIVAPGLSDKPIKLNNINLKGLGSKDDDVETTPAPVQQQPAQQVPVQTTAPAVAAPAAPTTTVVAAPTASYHNTTQTAPVAA